MADRTCTVSFFNSTRFQLTRLDGYGCKGHWDAEPPATIGPKRPGQPYEVVSWKSAATGSDPFGGTDGHVVYQIHDRLDGVTFWLPTGQQPPEPTETPADGPNGSVAVVWGSPWTGAPYGHAELRGGGELSGPVDLSPFYSVSISCCGNSVEQDGSVVTDFADMGVPGGILAVAIGAGNPLQHPVYSMDLRENARVADARAHSSAALQADDPHPRPMLLGPVRGADPNVWNGRWTRRAATAAEADVDVRVSRGDDGRYEVVLVDPARDVQQTFPDVELGTGVWSGFPGEFRRPIPSIVGEVAGEELGRGLGDAAGGLTTVASPVASAPVAAMQVNRDLGGATARSPIHATAPELSAPGANAAVELVAMVDTLRLSDRFALHLYGLKDVTDPRVVTSYLLHYEDQGGGSDLTSLLLPKVDVLR